MASPAWAEALAERYLSQALPRRWAHVQAVAGRAASAADALGDDADLLVCAAWLHDIGYAPSVADTGFHSLDGARLVESYVTMDAWPRSSLTTQGLLSRRRYGGCPVRSTLSLPANAQQSPMHFGGPT